MTHQGAGLVIVVLVLCALGTAVLQAVLPPYQPADPGVYMPGPEPGPFANW